MMLIYRQLAVLLSILLVIDQYHVVTGQRRKGGRKKGKAKDNNLFPFANAVGFNLLLSGSKGEGDPRAAKLIKTSHFMFVYMLGGKIWLICASEGEPRPSIVWYKDGSELMLKNNMHIYERLHSTNQTWNKIEIDPGTLGDGGIYSCYTSNRFGMMYKNFKVEPGA